MPASLTASTVRAAVCLAHEAGGAMSLSAPVAELLEGANPAMLWTRFKILTFVALGIGLLAVSAAVMAWREPTAPPADAPRAEATKAKADNPPNGAVQVRGRVLDPDGKPIAGVRLYWPRVPKSEPLTEEDIEIPQRGKSDAEGRFQFELPRSDIKPEWKLALIAAADGYGVAWTFWEAIEGGKEPTLRLVKDQPIEGRIVNTEGKPQAGVRVSILTLGTPVDGKMDTFINAWKREWRLAMSQVERMFLPLGKVLAPVTTDKDGRFRLVGAGAERLVILRVHGAEVSKESLYVINRADFDAAAVNKAVLDRIPAELRHPGQPPLLYGPKLTYVVPASRPIAGTVRETGSGKPVAGYRIHIGIGYGDGLVAVSDKDGRYHFRGVPKRKQYLLNADPPAKTAWLMSGARIDDTEGVQPLTVDFTVARGILLTGRVVDKTTGKGVRGGIRYVPLPGNKFAKLPGYDSYQYERLMRTVDTEGRFKFPVTPGPGVVMVQVFGGSEKANGGQAINPYKQAEFDAQDRQSVQINEKEGYFTSVNNSIEFLSTEQAVKVIDLAADAGTAECNLFLERGETMKVQIEDTDGKPLKGTTVAGVTAAWPNTVPIKDATVTVFALDPKMPRRVLFYHGERKLAGSLVVRGDEKEPPVARLTATGSVAGRVLDRDGQPIAGADVQLSSPERDASELYRQLDQKRKPIRTDKDGRFRIEGIVPEVKFQLNIYQGRTFLVGEPRIGARQVKSGATLDLGDVRTKPGP
jgi:protocatechuate 3,4-dioxygenase beta subunit